MSSQKKFSIFFFWEKKKISSIKKLLFGFQSWKNSQIHLKKIIWFQTLKKYLQKTAVGKKEFTDEQMKKR